MDNTLISHVDRVQTGRQRDRQTHRQIDRQTDKQIDGERDRQMSDFVRSSLTVVIIMINDVDDIQIHVTTEKKLIKYEQLDTCKIQYILTNFATHRDKLVLSANE